MGIGRYIQLREEPDVAEVARTVVDDHHRNGLGTLLLAVLWASARLAGIQRFRAFVGANNHPALRMLTKLGGARQLGATGVLRVDLPLDVDRLPMSPTTARLRSILEQVQLPARAGT